MFVMSILTFVYLQDATGRVLDKWLVTTRDEEQVILQQFLRFGETKSIAQEIILQDTRENRERQIINTPKTESEIKKFIERSNLSMQSYLRNYETRQLLNRHMASSGSTQLLSPPSGLPPSYSPPNSNREPVNMTIQSSQHNSPVSSSPLSRLQTMQPFDYRHISPTVSPVTSEKSITQSSGSKSPENLSMSSATTITPPAPCLTPTSLSVLSTGKPESVDDIKYVVAASSEDSNDEAINYSLKNINNNNNDEDEGCQNSSSSVYADRKIKHLRKSANPMKRQWVPSAAFGTTFISPSGKKRVLCTACNKTFCDKGALKIHYSAVHLKEMHKCTVEACGMMFSSRRSRNRHSANPNPKLHMPNAKRKLPDGGTVVDDKPPPNLPTSLPGVPHPITISPLSSLPLSAISPHGKPLVTKMEPISLTHDSSLLTEQRYYLDPNGHVQSLFSSPMKMPKLDASPEPLTSGNHTPTDSPVLSAHLQSPILDIKREQGRGGRSSRKRKSMVPTRCAQPTDESFVMSDENSNDGMGGTNIDTDDVPENLSMRPQDLAVSNKPDSRPNMDDMEEEEPMEEEDKREDCKEDCAGEEGCDEETACQGNDKLVTRSTFREIQQKAIKQMDSISEAKLRDVRVDSCKKSDSSGEVEEDDMASPNTSFEATSVSNNHHPEPNENHDHAADDINNSSPSAPLPKDGHISDADSNCSCDLSEHLNGGSANGSEDIIPEYDNPKKCSSCGKQFQNHFGVKTHYQNVHLKLMHTCNVDGCNAAFPSKRSRDRHSSNLNLHRKLLSTSSSDGESPSKVLGGLVGQTLREEFLPRIYDSHHYNNAFNQQVMRYDREEDHLVNSSLTTVTNSLLATKAPSTNDKPLSPTHNTTNGDSQPEDHMYDLENGTEGQDEDSPQPDPDGMVKCHICKQRFRDNLVLKEHYEKVHPKEMYRCTVSGCDKIFSTRKSRNRHSQNDNLHKQISPTKSNGTP